MAAKRAIAPAIEACYDAAFEFGRWPQALQTLADSLGVTSCVIRTLDQTHPFRTDQRRLTALRPDSTEHAEFAALWIERIQGTSDPHDERAARLAKPEICFIVEDEITTQAERKVHPYYQEIALPGHREWWASVGFMVKKRKWFLSMFREARRGPFCQSEADCFLSLVPDLSRIISAAEKIWEISISPSLAILDQLNCAAALLDCRGYVARYNEHAQVLLGADLMVHHGRIRAADRTSDHRLQGLIRAAMNAQGRSTGTEPVVIARNGSPWLLVEAMPMTSFVHDLFNGGDMLLYFTGLAAERPPDEQVLRSAFQLTAAEARLASCLTAGEGITAASDRLAISRETVRTQLRVIFAKTGTRRQAELTALLTRIQTRSKH